MKNALEDPHHPAEHRANSPRGRRGERGWNDDARGCWGGGGLCGAPCRGALRQRVLLQRFRDQELAYGLRFRKKNAKAGVAPFRQSITTEKKKKRTRTLLEPFRDGYGISCSINRSMQYIVYSKSIYKHSYSVNQRLGECLEAVFELVDMLGESGEKRRTRNSSG